MPTLKQLRRALRRAVSDGLRDDLQWSLDRLDTRVRLGVAVRYRPGDHMYLVVPWEHYPYYTGGGPGKAYWCRSMEPLLGEESKLYGVPRGVDNGDGTVELNTPLPCIFVELNGIGEDMGFVVLGFIHMAGDRVLGFKEGVITLKASPYYLIVDDGHVSIASPYARLGVKDDRIDISSNINLTEYGLESLINIVVDNDGVHIRGGDNTITINEDGVDIVAKRIKINGVEVDIPAYNGGD